MPTANYPCDEHRDLYLELLKKAEKEADRTLVQIILKKIQGPAPQPEMTQDGCMVFAFPALPAAACGPEADALFWKKRQFWQDLLQFMAFLTVGISFFIFFCSLICDQVVR
jgi:hypothetical protein